MRECLEQSEYDVGKARWLYDPDLFSWPMADRMTGFINGHYPKPIPANFRAVSNFMWVDMDDCMRMHDLLQVKFKWTEAAFERAAELKARGLTVNEVAKHLSPTLTGRHVSNAMARRNKPKSALISDAESTEIARLVDEYAGKYPVVKIIHKICDELVNLAYAWQRIRTTETN
ncbi:hypothetical protein GGI21_003385 [Coemansia aciculifera]|nr:hypothetical protein GGI21_003385 [Coemansia aciculifera]